MQGLLLQNNSNHLNQEHQITNSKKSKAHQNFSAHFHIQSQNQEGDLISTLPQSIPKPRGRPNGSKNLKRTVLDFDPDSIGQRTRSKLAKGNYDEDGDFLLPVVDLVLNGIFIFAIF